MKVLVTGASGFIGSRLARRLISEGDEVYGIIHEKQNTVEGMHVITADLSDSTFDIPDVNFDVAFHLAAATPLVKDKKKQKKINQPCSCTPEVPRVFSLTADNFNQ